MSFYEISKVTPSKAASGCGDGLKNGKILSEKRVPVPSSRRFTPRLKRDDDLKNKVEKALHELTKRSNSMAEITPTKTNPKKKIHATGSLNDRNDQAVNAVKKSKEAGRQIYQQLLLRAWRCRRAEVATLVESSNQLRLQIAHLERQKDALNTLIKSDCDKRTDLANENKILRSKFHTISKNNRLLHQEKEELERRNADMERKEVDLKTGVKNLENDLVAVRNELRASEKQMNKEREKLATAKKEKLFLTEKVDQNEREIEKQKRTIQELEEIVADKQEEMQEMASNLEQYRGEKDEMLMNILNHKEMSAQLENKIQDLQVGQGKLEGKILELKKKLTVIKDTKNKVDEENESLKNKIVNVQKTLVNERERPWWRNALASLNILQNVAYIMLPAFPATIDQATSTTDVSV